MTEPEIQQGCQHLIWVIREISERAASNDFMLAGTKNGLLVPLVGGGGGQGAGPPKALGFKPL